MYIMMANNSFLNMEHGQNTTPITTIVKLIMNNMPSPQTYQVS
jgi:hypothetical protein